ncbi:NmrA family NAD(P)-binding protein [Pedobacter heparinus]|uniref:NmrA family NAD(P)-binding protein n=1 Tax=Pedobacter heparinus TaxID=984 RepID=UPI0029318B07|nr:NmrA family NAD(P)-binding protein [Pedobacter heparinus]
MHIILGGTGNIGSVVASRLLEKGELVTIISHDEKKRKEWEDKGATVAVVDVLEVDKLRKVFDAGERLFLLNPPADPSTDTAKQEEKTVTAILDALHGSNIQKVVAESTYGAQPGKGIGDLGVLYEMEQALSKSGIPASVMHGAYYMSNWAFSADQVRETGQLYSLYPADFKLPMVSPADIGEFGAALMLETVSSTGNYYIEGPEQYSPGDVAEAFAEALDRSVKVVVIPQNDWVSFLQKGGFSLAAAESTAAMTKITLEQDYKTPKAPVKGKTTLKEFIRGVV